MLLVKLSFGFDLHLVWHLELWLGDGSCIHLVIQRVKIMGEESLYQFRQPKGFRKVGQGHDEEGCGVEEMGSGAFDVVRQLQDFPTITDLLKLTFLTMRFIHHWEAVIAPKIVRQHGQR